MHNFILPLLVLFIITSSCAPKGSVDLNKIENRVMDSSDILTTKEELDLYQSIRSLEEGIGSQIGVVIIDNLRGTSIEEYSIEVADKMRFGREKINDGILITVVVNERKIRIEVGYGLEKIIRDEIAAQIIREDIAPKFVVEQYFEGLRQGISKIKELIEANPQMVGQYP